MVMLARGCLSLIHNSEAHQRAFMSVASSTFPLLIYADVHAQIFCADDNTISIHRPAPSTEAVPFGRSSGWVREGTNWAYAGLLNEAGMIADYRAATAAAETGTGTGATVASAAKGDDEGCLFNVVEDLNESNNLRSDRAYANLWKKLVGMLAERGKSGPPLTSAFPLGEVNSTASNKRCAIGNATGYLFPTDYFS